MSYKKIGTFILLVFCLVLFLVGKHYSLGRYNRRDVDFWISKLNDSDNHLRQGAARTLGKLGDRKASAYLIEKLLHDENLWVRVESAIALGNLKDPAVVDTLIEALRSPNPPVRREVATALGEIGDFKAVEPLLARLDKDNNRLVRVRIIEALGMLKDKRAIEPISAYLKNEDIWTRWESHKALKRLGYE